jgi:hypothetical protein
MPQPRAPKTDWLLEAWKLANSLADVPNRPHKFGAAFVPLDDDIARDLRERQEHLNKFLQYRVQLELGAQAPAQFERFDAQHVVDTRNALTRAGMVFSERDQAAIHAHVSIAFILTRSHASEPMRSQLPVVLASVGGASAALQNAVRASLPRGRTRAAELKAARRKYKKQGLSWKQSLLQMKGDELIDDYDVHHLYWTDDLGMERKTAIGTFRNW